MHGTVILPWTDTHTRLKTLASPFSKWRVVNQNQRGVTHNEQKYAKETVRYKQVLVSELFNIAVNYVNAKKSARCNRTGCKLDPVC